MGWKTLILNVTPRTAYIRDMEVLFRTHQVVWSEFIETTSARITLPSETGVSYILN